MAWRWRRATRLKPLTPPAGARRTSRSSPPAAWLRAPTSGRALDFSLILAVCVHKVPEGLALGALLLGAGFNRAQTLARVAAVESTTLLGGVVGLVCLPHISAFWLDAVVAHVGGGFLFLAIHAVLGEIVKHHKALVLTNFALGLGAIATLSLLVRLL